LVVIGTGLNGCFPFTQTLFGLGRTFLLPDISGTAGFMTLSRSHSAKPRAAVFRSHKHSPGMRKISATQVNRCTRLRTTSINWSVLEWELRARLN
jgi:hypothetical protein